MELTGIQHGWQLRRLKQVREGALIIIEHHSKCVWFHIAVGAGLSISSGVLGPIRMIDLGKPSVNVVDEIYSLKALAKLYSFQWAMQVIFISCSEFPGRTI